LAVSKDRVNIEAKMKLITGLKTKAQVETKPVIAAK